MFVFIVVCCARYRTTYTSAKELLLFYSHNGNVISMPAFAKPTASNGWKVDQASKYTRPAPITTSVQLALFANTQCTHGVYLCDNGAAIEITPPCPW